MIWRRNCYILTLTVFYISATCTLTIKNGQHLMVKRSTTINDTEAAERSVISSANEPKKEVISRSANADSRARESILRREAFKIVVIKRQARQYYNSAYFECIKANNWNVVPCAGILEQQFGNVSGTVRTAPPRPIPTNTTTTTTTTTTATTTTTQSTTSSTTTTTSPPLSVPSTKDGAEKGEILRNLILPPPPSPPPTPKPNDVNTTIIVAVTVVTVVVMAGLVVIVLVIYRYKKRILSYYQQQAASNINYHSANTLNAQPRPSFSNQSNTLPLTYQEEKVMYTHTGDLYEEIPSVEDGLTIKPSAASDSASETYEDPSYQNQVDSYHGEYIDPEISIPTYPKSHSFPRIEGAYERPLPEQPGNRRYSTLHREFSDSYE